MLQQAGHFHQGAHLVGQIGTGATRDDAIFHIVLHHSHTGLPRIGGLQAARAPNFPAGAILITRYDNLSRYYQEGARRRTIIDNPKRDQIENYESSNDAYVVEDYGLAALAENITLA